MSASSAVPGDNDDRSTRSFRLAFGLCTVAALVPLWSVKYLPMVDLPQHAAQIFIWRNLENPAFDYSSRFELNWFTPYLLGYLLVRLFSVFLPLTIALKIVVSSAVVAVPFSLLFLIRRTGGDRWWALAGAPLAFGFSFFWGFFNFIVATPLVFAFLGVALGYAREPTVRRGVGLALFALALFVAHVLVLGLSLAAAGAVIALTSGSLRTALVRLLPLAVPVPVVAAWMLKSSADQAPVLHSMPTRFTTMPWQKVVYLLPTTFGHATDLEAGVAAGLLVALVLCSGRPRRKLWAWMPLAVGFLFYLGLPDSLFRTAFVYQRISTFLLPLLMVAWAPSALRWLRPVLVRAALLVVVLAWMSVLTFRFIRFDRDARDFDVVTAPIEPGKSLVSLSFVPQSDAIPGYPFLHFTAWSQAERGGIVGFSFAVFFQSLIRYRQGGAPPMTPALEWYPKRFDWRRDGGFDYFLLRAPVDLGRQVFRQAPGQVERVAAKGMWWLYRRKAGSGPAAAPTEAPAQGQSAP